MWWRKKKKKKNFGVCFIRKENKLVYRAAIKILQRQAGNLWLSSEPQLWEKFPHQTPKVTSKTRLEREEKFLLPKSASVLHLGTASRLNQEKPFLSPPCQSVNPIDHCCGQKNWRGQASADDPRSSWSTCWWIIILVELRPTFSQVYWYCEIVQHHEVIHH